jgi:hypothetical protein
MKKTYDYEPCCALCEYSGYIEIDEKYVCKYKNRLNVVDDNHSCRRFKFDLLKINPHPKMPYNANGVELEKIDGE